MEHIQCGIERNENNVEESVKTVMKLKEISSN